MRSYGRKGNGIRPVSLKKGYLKFADGSCLIEMGNTKVVCAASIESGVPHFLRDSGRGWVTAEYGMLPRSCASRTPRESTRGKVGGRTHEIQRLIGRSLRTAVDMKELGERTIWVDADVLQGDGGTRCAAITGSFVALCEAFKQMKEDGRIDRIPLKDYVAAISVGIVENRVVVDLDYEEDSRAEVDMNLVMTGRGRYIEVQGTAEREPFDIKTMNEMMSKGTNAIKKLIAMQKKALEGFACT